jgi:hypothetical protein
LTSRTWYLPTAPDHIRPHLFVAVLIAAAWVLAACSLFSGEPTFEDYVGTGGSAAARRHKPPTKIEEELVFSHPETRPAWAASGVTKAEDGDYRFTGVSRRFTTEQQARTDALQDAREQITAYLVTDVKREVNRVTVTSGSSSQILDPGSVQEEITRLLSATTLVGTAASEFYIQRWVRREDDVESVYWKAYSLVVFPEKQNREIRDAILRRTAQRRLSRLESLSKSRPLAKDAAIRDFEGRMQAVRQSLKDGRYMDAISEAEELLEQFPVPAAETKKPLRSSAPPPAQETPPTKPARPATDTAKQPSRTPVRPSVGWRASLTDKQKRARSAKASVRSGLHTTHRALELLADDHLVQARKLLVDGRSKASRTAKEFNSAELRYQARVFDEFLKDSLGSKPDQRKILERLLSSYWRAAVDNNRCPQCGAKHKPR